MKLQAGGESDTNLSQESFEYDDVLDDLHVFFLALAGVTLPVGQRDMSLQLRFARGAGGVAEQGAFITDWDTRELALIVEVPLLELP